MLNQVPDDNKAEGAEVSVELETLRPVCQKLPTARWGKPFCSQGILHKDICKIPENSESADKVEQHNALEGDEAIVEESTSYEDWLCDQGLSMNSTETTEFHVKVKVEDITDNKNENKNSGDEGPSKKTEENSEVQKCDGKKKQTAQKKRIQK